jgi:predicted transcriptional regulator
MDPIDDRYVRLGAILRKARLKAGLKQWQLAERVGHQQAFVARVEKGTRPLTVLQLLDICKNVDADPARVIRQVAKAG